MRGSFKKKTGKVMKIELKTGKVYIEGIQKTKKDGSKVNVPVDASNLQIQELSLDDKRRLESIGRKGIKNKPIKQEKQPKQVQKTQK